MNHPRWFTFNRAPTNPVGYDNLILPQSANDHGAVTLNLVVAESDAADGRYLTNPVIVKFRGDRRLSSFRPIAIKKKVNRRKESSSEKKVEPEERDAVEYLYFDRHLGIERKAKFKGVKLVFRGIRPKASDPLKHARAYLYFTCEIKNEASSGKLKGLKLSDPLPSNTVAAAVDLKLTEVAFATLAIYRKQKIDLIRSRNLWIGRYDRNENGENGNWSNGPKLEHIARHKQQIRELRKKRGRPVHGEKSHVRLQRHITKMGEDRFKKAARAIVAFALNTDRAVNPKTGKPFPKADVLVIEWLRARGARAGLIPDAAKQRGINKSLASWNRAQLVNRLKEVAEDVGLPIREIPAAGTSQACSKCGSLGRRYSIIRDSDKPAIRFGEVEKLFVCPECGHKVNADHNASVNLHRRLVLGKERFSAKLVPFWSKSKSDRRRFRDELEKKVLPGLLFSHSIRPKT
jgi:transposase